jgi:DNA-binding transcriptional regulator YiaG
MRRGKGALDMSAEEIQELLDLKGWRTARLADYLEVKENTVECWLTGKNPCRGPAKVLMKQMLEAAKGELAGAK